MSKKWNCKVKIVDKRESRKNEVVKSLKSVVSSWDIIIWDKLCWSFLTMHLLTKWVTYEKNKQRLEDSLKTDGWRARTSHFWWIWCRCRMSFLCMSHFRSLSFFRTEIEFDDWCKMRWIYGWWKFSWEVRAGTIQCSYGEFLLSWRWLKI